MDSYNEAAWERDHKVRVQVAKILYPLFMSLLVIWFLATIGIALVLVVSNARGVLEPNWHVNITPLIDFAARLITPLESDASRALDAAFLTLLALVMGIFLRRCALNASRLEIGLIFFFLISGITKLILVMLLPSGEEARNVLFGGGDISTHISLILTRNSNLALALFSSAIGVHYYH